MAAVVHLIAFRVLAQPFGCSAPRRVTVLWRLHPAQHMGPRELPLSFAGEPALMLRSCNLTAQSLPASSAVQNDWEPVIPVRRQQAAGTAARSE